MNDVIINGKSYKYETVNQKSPNITKKWQNKNNFIEQLSYIESFLNKRGSYNNLDDDEKSDCKLCNKTHIKTKTYRIGKIMWDNSLLHYIKKHNIKPLDYFIDKIFKYQPDKKIISIKRDRKLKGIKIIKRNKVFLKLDRNQLLIMDALYEHGGKKVYAGKKGDKTFKFSEHSGLLDFNDFGLERIIVSGKTTRIDKNDDEIFLPKNMVDAYDYEYIFHTHPATPKVGGRVVDGILYEFPSSSDIFHFIDHYNDGETQGSIVITPEGMYVIRKHINDNKKITIDEDELFDKLNYTFGEIQNQAIEKYGTKFTENKFFKNIAQDTTYINILNKLLHKYQLHIDYFSRIKDSTGKWILDTVYLPVYVVEPYKV